MPESAVYQVADRVRVVPAVVAFYFAARLCITFLGFTSDPKTGAYVNFAIHFLLFAAAVFYSFGPARRTVREMFEACPFKWVVAFLLMGLCSLAWSSTASMPVAIAYWFELASEVALVIMILRVDDCAAATFSVAWGYAWGAIVICAVEWLSPTMYDLRPGDDDFFSPNAIGFTCALGIFLLQIAGRRTVMSRIVAAVLAISLLRSLSQTTVIAFVIAQGSLLLLDRSRSWRGRFGLVAVAVLVVVPFFGLIQSYYDVYTHLGNQSETLSGRLGIWAFVLARSVEQPWIGHGFHSFRNVIPPFGSFEAWHAHNELLQQFYAYGGMGVALVVSLYVSLFRQIRNANSSRSRSTLTALLLFILIRGLTDTENFDLSLPLWLITLLSVWLRNGSTLPVASQTHPVLRTSLGTDSLAEGRA